MTAAYPESLLPRVRAAVEGALTCQAEPVRLALDLHLSQRLGSLRALLACVLDDSAAALSVGVALDLIHVGLQRLHLRLDDGEGVPALLGTGACVLAGDYLTSGAFKVLIGCSDMAVLSRVARTITLTCERDVQALPASADGGRPSARRRAALDLPLARVAAECGALLSPWPALLAPARRLGERLLAAQALHSLAEQAEAGTAEPWHRRSQRALAGAARIAERLDRHCGHGRASALVRQVEQALKAPRPALALGPAAG